MMYLVLDSETTGLFDFSKPAHAEGQPRLASVGMIILDDDLSEVSRKLHYIKPDGWEMPKEAAEVNGLTMELLEANGVPVRTVLESYVALLDEGHIVLAYNAQYDTKVMRGELRRAGMDDRFKATPNACLMRACTPICQIPRNKGKGIKFPKLIEACEHFGIPLAQAHTAMGDAEAAANVARCLKALNSLPEPAVHFAKRTPDDPDRVEEVEAPAEAIS